MLHCTQHASLHALPRESLAINPQLNWGACRSHVQCQACCRPPSNSSAMNAESVVSAACTPPGCYMQAVSYAMKMLQACSPIRQCIVDGQLSKAQQLLEKASSQWHPASKSASELGRCCSLHHLSSAMHQASLFCCTKLFRSHRCLAWLLPRNCYTSLMSSNHRFSYRLDS